MSVTPGIYTDTAVVAAFPSAAQLTPDEQRQAAIDVGAVYEHAASNPGLTESDLRAWGETQGILPFRMNVALGLLQEAGKLFTLPRPGPLNPNAVPFTGAPARTLGEADPAPAAGSFPAEHLTVAELQRLAKRVGLEVPSSATKADLLEALTR